MSETPKLVCESHVNATEGYRLCDDWVNPFENYVKDAETIGGIYRAAQRLYGRCTGKVYIDTADGVIAIGWVFVKREKYEDSPETFLHETWITLLDRDETIHERDYHAIPGR